MLPKAFEDLITEFMKFPGVGRKTAERYALYTFDRLSDEDTDRFSHAIASIKQEVHHCPVCGHLTDQEKCDVCSNPNRNDSLLMVVESSKDVFSIEKSGEYKGYYHVLNGNISPMDGIGPEDINIATLWPRIVDSNKVKEVIIATSSTQEGETTALYINKVLKDIDVIVTRIGYGVPVGLNLEYADDLTLSKAIENRRKI